VDFYEDSTVDMINCKHPERTYYFVHSYGVESTDSKNVGFTSYGGGKFVSAVQKDNIFGVQFHPEKSSQIGLNLLKKFCELKNE
jgi:glutamine amidotransferase